MISAHCKQAIKAMRYFLFPASKRIDDRTEEIDRSLTALKESKAQVVEMTRNVNQPDVLRSLVLSMNASGK